MIPVCNHGRQLVSTERTIYWRSHDCHLDNLLEKSRTTERRSQTTDRPRRRCKSAEALGQSGRSLQFNVQRHAGTMRQNWTVLQTTTTTKTHSGVFFCAHNYMHQKDPTQEAMWTLWDTLKLKGLTSQSVLPTFIYEVPLSCHTFCHQLKPPLLNQSPRGFIRGVDGPRYVSDSNFGTPDLIPGSCFLLCGNKN